MCMVKLMVLFACDVYVGACVYVDVDADVDVAVDVDVDIDV